MNDQARNGDMIPLFALRKGVEYGHDMSAVDDGGASKGNGRSTRERKIPVFVGRVPMVAWGV